MKNNKAFTLVEMLVSFSLAMVLVIIMFQLIINLKELYMSSGIKTELLNKQYLMTNKIYKDLIEKKAINIDNCNNTSICIQFTFQDGTVKRLEVDELNKTLTYDDYTIKLSNKSYFGAMNINTYFSITNNKIFNANIPIYNDLFKNTDFGINIVYPYKDTEVVNTTNYNYKINGITIASSNSTPTMEQPVTYTGLGETGNIYIKQGETTLGTINMQGRDPLMCSNGICDYIDYENNVIVRYIKKYTFTGGEQFNHTAGWASNDTETTKGLYWSNSTILGIYGDNKFKSGAYGFSSHFPIGDTAYTKNDTLRYSPNGNSAPPYLSFRIPIDIDINTWITEQYNAGTPLIAYYILNEPEYETIPLPNINTFTDITTLTITDGTTSSTIE